MEENQTIELFLTQPQFSKYRKGKTFQLTNSQLQSDLGKHKVDIYLGKSDYNNFVESNQERKRLSL